MTLTRRCVGGLQRDAGEHDVWMPRPACDMVSGDLVERLTRLGRSRLFLFCMPHPCRGRRRAVLGVSTVARPTASCPATATRMQRLLTKRRAPRQARVKARDHHTSIMDTAPFPHTFTPWFGLNGWFFAVGAVHPTAPTPAWFPRAFEPHTR